MVPKNDDRVLKAQSLMLRTHLGRKIGGRAAQAVEAWEQYRNDPHGRKECKVCGLILNSRFFVNGCLNCGSTDNKTV